MATDPRKKKTKTKTRSNKDLEKELSNLTLNFNLRVASEVQTATWILERQIDDIWHELRDITERLVALTKTFKRGDYKSLKQRLLDRFAELGVNKNTVIEDSPDV